MSIRSSSTFLLTVAALGASLATPGLARAELPSLERAIQLARTRAIAVAEAEGELGAANAQMAGAKMSSVGNFYSEIQVDRAIDPASPVQALTFNYLPIDIAGQRGKRIDEADRLIEWRKIGLVSARASATADVVAAYGDIVVSSQRVVEATKGEQTARDEAKYFEGRFEAKDTTLYEKSLAEAEVARWVQSRAEGELRLVTARSRLMVLTGPIDTAGGVAEPNVVPPQLRATWDDAYVTRVIDRVPTIARLNAERTYWESSVERYEREKIPPVTFEIIAGRGGQGEARLGGGAIITLPITRRYQGEIARAEAGRANAVKQATLYRSVLEARMRAARDALVTVRKTIDELDKTGMPALERAVTASVEGFKAGKIDLSRAMLARRDLAIARSRRLDLLEAGWRAYADLVVLSGDLP